VRRAIRHDRLGSGMEVIEVRQCSARVLRRLGDQAGATAVEYALMLALIAMVIAVAVAYMGHATSNQFASFKFSP
jgi:Flp pilus assembly pilin Flp